jgi:hypothetical protein
VLRCLGALTLVLGGAVAGRAEASELSWDGPVECAGSEQLLFAVERALATPLAQAARLKFDVRVESSESIASARLRVTRLDAPAKAKERLLAAADCSRLIDTLAVAITLAIGASEAEGGDAEAAADATPIAVAHEPARRERAEQVPPGVEDDGRGELPDNTRDALNPGVFLALVGDTGSLPEPAVGVSLGGRLGWRGVSLRASATMFLEQQVRVPSAVGGDAGAEVGLFYGSLLACADALGGSGAAWSVPLCAGADVGQLSGVGVGAVRPRQGRMLWAAPRVDVGLAWDVPHTQLRVGPLLEAAMPLNRDEFVLDDIGTVHRPGRLVGRAALNIELRLE